ncbi:MAG: TetR/AcrR family transcriptional regulator [Saprospiraceae bacterium]|nr:TetR/AcrR family transcriptional regulator [Saprospiraceae bacterium]
MFTEQQEKWLRRTEDLFMRYGIKGLTMDDVARELGISKKTLYQFVENKDDLVIKVVERHVLAEKERDCMNQGEAENALQEIFMVIQQSSADFQRMKSNLIFELQRFHRAAWEKIQEYQQKHLYQIVLDNLHRGIREGLYRPTFQPDIMARLHNASIFLLFDETIFPYAKYSREEILREYLLHYLYGIVSDRGRELLNAKLT